MSRRHVGSSVLQFTRSLLVLGALVVAAPAGLAWAARRRFGGAMPLHGVPSPADWEWSRIRAALTDRLTEQTVADIVIRGALAVAWVGLVVFLLIVTAECLHMVRHAGMHLPDVRGLGFTQHAARVVAAGLLVLLPVLSSPTRAIAHSDAVLTAVPRDAVAARVLQPQYQATGLPTAVAVVESPTTAIAAGGLRPVGGVAARVGEEPLAIAGPDASAAPVAGSAYVVRPGDSIYGIARQVVGNDPVAVADYAERILDANQGRDMGDGRRFVNAALIDVGWVIDLPSMTTATGAEQAIPAPQVHVVERGESLWSIAEDELGDPVRWPELFEENAGRTFADGHTLSEPHLIQPGWHLSLPGSTPEAVEPASPAPDEPPASPPPETLPEVAASEPHAVDDADAPWGAPSAEEVLDVVDVLDGRAGPDDGPRPEVVWIDEGGASRSAGSSEAEPPAHTGGRTVRAEPDGTVPPATAEHLGLVTLRAAAMLSCGVVTLLAVRRRRQLRQTPPRARLAAPSHDDTVIERMLRASDVGERLVRVDIAIRAAAMALVERGRRVQMAMCSDDGEVELLVDGPVELPAPWHGEHEHWVLPASTSLEVLAPQARLVGAPCPTLVQLGIDEIGRDVYVDLEAIEALEIGGSADDADAIVAAIAATLGGSALAEVTTLVGVDVPEEAFLGHRSHRPATDPVSAFELARLELGTTASVTTSTFELRSRVTSGEMWEPAVVLLGSGVDVVRPPRDRTGLAVVSAAPIEGPSSRLAPEGGIWMLKPAGIRLRPVGIRPPELGALANLMHGATVIPTIPDEDDMQLHDDDLARTGDDTIYDTCDTDADDDGDGDGTDGDRVVRVRPTVDDATGQDSWTLLVRLLGSVEVVDRDGRIADFGRTKTKELVAWLATHRERSTRSNARTALWDHEVRDATFANVVSEARRSLARLVDAPPGDEWVGRTMTDALPLHAQVRTDAELLEAALRSARLQPPDQAIVTLTPAVERITGVPFEGAIYMWPDAEGITTSLILLATSAAAELAAHCLSVGDVEGVFRATGRGLRVLPGHEELIGLRMRAHARVGDLAGVRSEWETYERMVNGDPWSDGEPSPKLLDLRANLLHPSR